MQNQPGEARGAVVVSGASSGIGEATALLLAAHGFVVYAGVRREADAEALVAAAGSAAPNIKPVLLDVTSEEQIAAAANQIAREAAQAGEGGILRGIVNNAGIAVAAPLEHISLDEFRQQLEVNVTGQVAVAQAFLPQLRRSKGRLVFSGSMSGLISTRLLGAYSASKFALEAVADAYRRELRPFGVRVALIELGRIRTPIWERSLRDGLLRLEEMGPEARESYGHLVDDLITGARVAAERATPPAAAAKTIMRALTARRVRSRYFVGLDAHVVNVLRRVAPDPLLDRILEVTRD